MIVASMTAEQIAEIRVPADVRANSPSNKIERVRFLIQKEMVEKGTTDVKAASGDGFEIHVKETYA